MARALASLVLKLQVLNRDLEESHNVNSELQVTVAELESQLQQLKAVKEPFSSTPYPHHAPSLHEEMLSQERQREPVSPLNLSRGDLDHSRTPVTPGMQSFNKFMEDTVSMKLS